jgi:branched-chain amino acid transport system ATP-binding protein
MLSVKALNAHYGASHALHGVDFELHDGTILAVLGRNGVGKTTTVRAIMGLVRPSSGNVLLDGQDIAGWPPHRVARTGVAYVPEGRLIFPELTVIENIRVAERRPAKSWSLQRLLELFPALRERPATRARSSRAASNRCWRLPGRSSATRRCCSSTNRARVWHLWSCASWRGSCETFVRAA